METTSADPTSRHQPGLAILAAAALLGLAGDLLLRTWPPGVNVGIWVALLLGALLALARVTALPLRGEGRWLLPVAFLFAAAFAWRASPVLQALNAVALGVALFCALFRVREGTIRVGGVSDFVVAQAAGIGSWFAGLAMLAVVNIDWRTLQVRGRSPRATALLRGAFIAAPLLFVFGTLFASADAVFANMLDDLWRIDALSAVRHIGWTLFWTWASAGLLWQAFLFDSPRPMAVRPGAFLRLGRIEVSTTLGLIDLLFATFVVIQVRYLFGGADLVQSSVGLTYSEYARRGFFELLAVAALVLPVILGVHWLLRDANRGLQRTFTFFAGVLVLLLFVVITSALQRMRAYVDEFGLTQRRLYSTAAMAWLAIVFAWLALTVFRAHRKAFAPGAVAGALLVVMALNAVNPDRIIVETNAANSGHPFDAGYASSLSPDATPTIVAKLAALSPRARCELARDLLSREANDDWRSWNLSRAQAVSTNDRHRTELERACE